MVVRLAPYVRAVTQHFVNENLLPRIDAGINWFFCKIWRPEGSSYRPPLLTLGRQPQGRRPSLLLRLGIRRIFSRLPLALILESLGEFVVAFDNA